MGRLVGAAAGLAAVAFVTGHGVAQEPTAAAPGYDWTGLYAGIHAGYGWNSSSSTAVGFPEPNFASGPSVPETHNLSASGAIGGGQIGYNRQIDRLVLGIEADLSAGSLTGSAQGSGATAARGTPFNFTESQRIEPFGTFASRLGVTPIDRLMIFGTAGGAYGYVLPATDLAFPRVAYPATDPIAKVGWAAGGGVEYAVLPALSLKLEYLHYDLGGATVVGLPTPANPPFQTQTHVDFAADFVKIGLNYHFGAEDGGDADIVAALQQALQGFEAELGTRYWYSTGRTSYAYPTNQPLVSKLTYDGLTAQSGELFYRVDSPVDLFVKGYVGLGGITAGRLLDEDFPPQTSPYSATSSHQKDGSLTYYDVDVGYNLFSGDGYRVGPLVGYQYFHEVRNAYSCNQLATNPDFCVPALPSSTLGITDDDQWQSLRMGVTGDVWLNDNLKLSADAAWLPFSYLDGRDTHWLRLDTPGGFLASEPLTGTGHDGYQVEAVLSYQVAPAVSLGVGGRLWHDEATGFVHQENILVSSPGMAVPAKFTTDRYGGFLQAAVHF
jgi:opacity protein-like surface antigen